jgi:hypothetical protein
MRVPRITGLPSMTAGLTSIRSVGTDMAFSYPFQPLFDPSTDDCSIAQRTLSSSTRPALEGQATRHVQRRQPGPADLARARSGIPPDIHELASFLRPCGVPILARSSESWGQCITSDLARQGAARTARRRKRQARRPPAAQAALAEGSPSHRASRTKPKVATSPKASPPYQIATGAIWSLKKPPMAGPRP